MEVREAGAAYDGLMVDADAVPVDYKRTEVGVIPRDWAAAQISSLQPFVTSGSRGWAAFYSEYGSPFIRITNLSRESIYPDLDDLRFVQLPANDSEGARTQLKNGDVLISITADIGIIGHVTDRVPKPAYINQHIALIRFDPARADSRFMSYFLASERPQANFRSLTDSGAKAGMNLTTVQQIMVAFPPTVVEQEAIAEALFDTDALIESLEQLLAKKRQIKQGTMQELLTGKRRLPGFNEDWKVKRLEEVFSISVGRSKSAYVVSAGQYWVVDMGSITTDGRLKASKATNFSGDFLSVGDLVMPKDDIGGGGIIGKVGYIDSEKTYVLGDHVYRLTANAGDSLYLSYVINGHLINTELRKKVIGSAQLGLGRKSVSEQEVPFPAHEEQAAMARILGDMDTEIITLESRLIKVRQLKQGMMQELLTGRIRLPSLESEEG
jgi:type I restriction enzyme S subunit